LVTLSNDALEAHPAKVNEDPEGAAWFFKLKVSDKSAFAKLMDQAAYQEFVKGL
jgi:glycine cleavage system H protein